MTALVLQGTIESVPYDVYAAAGARWLARQALYETRTIDGFQYLPTSAWIFSVFTLLGRPLGDCAWRALSCSLYAWATWRMSKRLVSRHARAGFFVATCMSITLVLNNLRSGQANLILGALSLHAAADLAGRHWWRAAATLAFGLAIKPLMVVLVLLTWGLYRPMMWRLPVTLAGVLAVPWLTCDCDWLLQQYKDCLIKLTVSATPDRLFEDIRSLVVSLNVSLTNENYLAVRIATGLGVFAIAWRARTDLREPFASFLVAALAATYVVILNPRTQATSYVMTAPYTGLLAALYTTRGRYREALALAVLVLCWNLSGPWFAIVRYWLKPLAGIAFFVMLTREVFGATTSSWQRLTFLKLPYSMNASADRSSHSIRLS